MHTVSSKDDPGSMYPLSGICKKLINNFIRLIDVLFNHLIILLIFGSVSKQRLLIFLHINSI
jgi:hypothetical protein